MKCHNTVYYYNETTDEVVNFNIKQKKINNNYNYLIKNPILKIFSFVLYRGIITPATWIYIRLINHIKIINKSILKKFSKGGYFVYSNHTMQFEDALCPIITCFPNKPYTIVNPDNISIPVVGKLIKICGALPIPNNLSTTKKFYSAIETCLNKNSPIIIYPEAHLWPYYTKIRKFKDTPFLYPIKFDKPVFCFTSVFKKSQRSKKPKVEIFVDGPFYFDKTIHPKQAQKNLCNTIFETMQNRSLLSNYEYIKYIRREND